MRTLCLNLQQNESPAIAENFLSFSPQVYFRDPNLIFLDVSRTAHLFGGEGSLIQEALSFSHEFFPEAKGAIANTPATAQIFSSQHPSFIAQPQAETQDLSNLPLSCLTELEGLTAWKKRDEVEDIVHFFGLMGIEKIGEIRPLDIDSFRSRWGKTGELLWKRLHGHEKQVISPLLPTESLSDFIHLDFPVSIQNFLMHCIEKSFRRLFPRLQARGEFAQKLVLHLYCEYSDECHMVELIPANANRNKELFLKLIENKLSQLSFDNPIRELEIEILPCPEKIHQLDFWEPRASNREQLNQVMSLFQQASITTGFVRPKNEFLPESSWELTPEFDEFHKIEDTVHIDGQSFSVKPAYSKEIIDAPRPQKLLDQPLRVNARQLNQLQFLSDHPVERIECDWWEQSRGRDYYFALDKQGQMLWIYCDKIENEFYIHGYFDSAS